MAMLNNQRVIYINIKQICSVALYLAMISPTGMASSSKVQ